MAPSRGRQKGARNREKEPGANELPVDKTHGSEREYEGSKLGQERAKGSHLAPCGGSERWKEHETGLTRDGDRLVETCEDLRAEHNEAFREWNAKLQLRKRPGGLVQVGDRKTKKRNRK